MPNEEIKINLDDDTISLIKDLKTKLNFDSESEVISYAVAILTEVLNERKKGKNVFIPSGARINLTESTTTFNLPY